MRTLEGNPFNGLPLQECPADRQTLITFRPITNTEGTAHTKRKRAGTACFR